MHAHTHTHTHTHIYIYWLIVNHVRRVYPDTVLNKGNSGLSTFTFIDHRLKRQRSLIRSYQISSIPSGSLFPTSKAIHQRAARKPVTESVWQKVSPQAIWPPCKSREIYVYSAAYIGVFGMRAVAGNSISRSSRISGNLHQPPFHLLCVPPHVILLRVGPSIRWRVRPFGALFICGQRN